MKANEFYCESDDNQVAIVAVMTRHYDQWLKTESDSVQRWLTTNEFKATSGQVCLLADESGEIAKVFLGIKGSDDNNAWAILANRLPQGDYKPLSPISDTQALMWGLAQYQFSQFKEQKQSLKRLVLATEQLTDTVSAAEAVFLVRDLINRPTNDMGPADLAKVMQELAKSYQAEFRQWVGDDLLTSDFPAIHAVGRASDLAPRLLELRWGDSDKPLVSLVGKGVCFDSGGLDIKPSQGMRLMKKDMGGAAHVIGLAKWIMQNNLPIQLQVLVPAVENAIAGNAYRPGDIIETRKGLSVEIGNTDAEGRVVLADALAYASEAKPELIIDYATLTGAARVAVGTDIGAMFCNDDDIALAVSDASKQTSDPVWRLPLHQEYLEMIQPKVADLSNSAISGYAGAITAALFLQQFVAKDISWLHFDVMAWNTSNKPGKPAGGEALAMRAVYAYLQQRFCG